MRFLIPISCLYLTSCCHPAPPPIPPPPVTITIPATPCHIPVRPANVDPKSLTMEATAQGVGVWMSVADWKAMLKHEVEMQRAYDGAQGCNVP